MGVVIAIARSVLPARLRDTAYALAAEVVAADLLERLEELRVLQLLREALELDPDTVQAIEATVRARHRRLA